MYLGTQGQPVTDDELGVLSQLGVNHISSDPEGPWTGWDRHAFAAHQERLAKYGITLDMSLMPLGSRSAFENDSGNVFLGPSKERDEEIDLLCHLIEEAGAAGVRALRYNITILGHMRTEPTYGRGGAQLSSFDYSKLDQTLGEFEGGAADADEMWERIDYFLSRVVPVAESNKVQIACHPMDPGIGNREYRGVARVMGTVDGLKKFISMHESAYHGLNFCQGTVSEMLENPGEEIFDVIRYFGERKKIFNVHFRNIKGGFLDFVEVFPDEGDIDMLKAIKVYRDVGYEYMLMPDHVPGLAGDNARRVGFAYCYGYINAALQTVFQ
ncbi:MAG TPA: mannonate dehydratase [Dehalococcoidia bacterium]|nr:mannonate dehydratase [Dehalococcoidia bacterium]HIK88620.1 mannonate dehydratase [Dehalococcoidia bacterium]